MLASNSNQYFAAIDLGSNSFRLSIVEYNQATGTMEIVCQEKETVRLAKDFHIAPFFRPQIYLQALEAITLFQSKLVQFPSVAVKVVATNAFRLSSNAKELCQDIEKILHVPVNIISGDQEAQYIYHGVYADRQLTPTAEIFVIDIGGGSSECIIGHGRHLLALHSFPIGCLIFSQQYFSEDYILATHWEQAVQAAKTILEPVKKSFLDLHWTQAFGSSGTIKAVYALLAAEDLLLNHAITPRGIEYFAQRFLLDRSLTDIARLRGIKPQRVAVLPGGLAILYALMDTFAINELLPANGALRMGVLLEMMK